MSRSSSIPGFVNHIKYILGWIDRDTIEFGANSDRIWRANNRIEWVFKTILSSKNGNQSVMETRNGQEPR